MEGVLTVPKPNYPNPDRVELALINQVRKLEAENRLDFDKNFKPLETLEFLNELDFNDIEKIFDSLDD